MFLFLGRDKEPDTEIVELVYIQFVSLRFQESSSFLQKKNQKARNRHFDFDRENDDWLLPVIYLGYRFWWTRARVLAGKYSNQLKPLLN